MNNFEQIAAMILQGMLSNSAIKDKFDDCVESAIECAIKLIEQLPDMRRRVLMKEGAGLKTGAKGYFEGYRSASGNEYALIEFDNGNVDLVNVKFIKFINEVKE